MKHCALQSAGVYRVYPVIRSQALRGFREWLFFHGDIKLIVRGVYEGFAPPKTLHE